MSSKITVFIVDDHVVVREGLRALLSTDDTIEIIGDAGNGVQATEKVSALNPDVILMDLVMPEQDGIQTIQQLKAQGCMSRILVLTSFAEDDKVLTAIKAGALGYLLKDSAPDDILEAIHHVFNNETSLHPTIARKLIQELHQPTTTAPPYGETLTEREVEVLKLVAKGLGNQEIADQMVISERTVRTHVSNILGKLHLVNRTQAALYALRGGLISLDETETPN